MCDVKLFERNYCPLFVDNTVRIMTTVTVSKTIRLIDILSIHTSSTSANWATGPKIIRHTFVPNLYPQQYLVSIMITGP